MFISYKELSASSRVKRRRRNAPIGANALFRWNRRLLRTSSKGDAPDIAVTVKNQAGRIYQGSGLVPRVLSIILLICIMYIFHGEDFIHVLRWLHKIGRGRGLCPQQERAAVPGCGTSAISSSEQGWYPIKMERNNNATTTTTTTSVGVRKHAYRVRAAADAGNFIYLFGIIPAIAYIDRQRVVP